MGLGQWEREAEPKSTEWAPWNTGAFPREMEGFHSAACRSDQQQHMHKGTEMSASRLPRKSLRGDARKTLA